MREWSSASGVALLPGSINSASGNFVSRLDVFTLQKSKKEQVFFFFLLTLKEYLNKFVPTV